MARSRRADPTPYEKETPVKNVVLIAALAAASTLAPRLARAEEGVAVVSSEKKVQPGLVKWHRSLADAIAAAAKTKKPVLHFQLLGELDQEFC
jgi:molybdopterin-guanine dinucleotide biosynthesis protein A